jgi:hypothetical protein
MAGRIRHTVGGYPADGTYQARPGPDQRQRPTNDSTTRRPMGAPYGPGRVTPFGQHAAFQDRVKGSTNPERAAAGANPTAGALPGRPCDPSPGPRRSRPSAGRDPSSPPPYGPPPLAPPSTATNSRGAFVHSSAPDRLSYYVRCHCNFAVILTGGTRSSLMMVILIYCRP